MNALILLTATSAAQLEWAHLESLDVIFFKLYICCVCKRVFVGRYYWYLHNFVVSGIHIYEGFFSLHVPPVSSKRLNIICAVKKNPVIAKFHSAYHVVKA